MIGLARKSKMHFAHSYQKIISFLRLRFHGRLHIIDHVHFSSQDQRIISIEIVNEYYIHLTVNKSLYLKVPIG